MLKTTSYGYELYSYSAVQTQLLRKFLPIDLPDRFKSLPDRFKSKQVSGRMQILQPGPHPTQKYVKFVKESSYVYELSYRND